MQKIILLKNLQIYNIITDVKRLNPTNRITRVKTLAFADLLFANASYCSVFPFPFKAFALWGPQKLCRLNFVARFYECGRGGIKCRPTI